MSKPPLEVLRAGFTPIVKSSTNPTVYRALATRSDREVIDQGGLLAPVIYRL